MPEVLGQREGANVRLIRRVLDLLPDFASTFQTLEVTVSPSTK